MKCQAILKSGERIGQECGSKATIDGNSYCGRHYMIKKEMKGEYTITQKRLCGKRSLPKCKRYLAFHSFFNFLNSSIIPI